MRTFPAEEALVVAYWRKLVSSNRVAYKSRARASVRHATALRTQPRRTAHSLQTRPGSGLALNSIRTHSMWIDGSEKYR